MLFKYLLFGGLFMFASTSVSAQMTPDAPGADSVATAILPIAGYSSDTGFVLGGVYSRHDYRGNTEPFNQYQQVQALISTNGYVKIKGTHEQTDAPFEGYRTTIEGYLNRYSEDTYFGLGNDSEFNQQQWEDDYYFFESVSFGLEYQLRRQIYEQDRQRLDVAGGVGFDYQIPYDKQPNSSFAENQPPGSSGGWVNFINAGMIWENRDSEFDPQRGNRMALDVRYAPKYLSNYPLTTVNLELRQYVKLFDAVTLAARGEGRHAGADVPYWELSTLGDDFSLRGYPRNRFKGNTSLTWNLELRSWILKFPELENLKFGGHLFTDGGRVFDDENSADDLFQDYKKTIGGGGTISAFSPDFIMRGEIGFSEDTARIYVGVGYMF